MHRTDPRTRIYACSERVDDSGEGPPPNVAIKSRQGSAAPAGGCIGIGSGTIPVAPPSVEIGQGWGCGGAKS